MVHRVLIIGAGPVGVSLAANLSWLGISVALQGRSGLVEHPLVYRQSVNEWVYDVKLEHSESYDMIFICTKAYDIESALMSHKEILSQTSKIVFMTNGYTKHIINDFTSSLPDAELEFGVTDRAVIRKSSHDFEAKSESGCYFWSGKIQTDFERTILSKMPELFKISMRADLFLRKKWISNVVINSLTAAHSYQKNGLVDVGSDEFKIVFEEAFALSLLLYPDTNLDRANTLAATKDLIVATKDNFNSMAFDRQLGRKTESDYLAGISRNYEGFPTLLKLHKKITGLL